MTVTALVTQISPDQWSMIGDAVIGSILTVPAMAGVKKWLDVHHELVMFLYVIGASALTAGIAYVKDNPNFAPWLFIPAAGSGIFVLTQVLYYVIWKPGKKRLAGALVEAQKLNDAKRAAAVTIAPADGSMQ
jgi:hypothetical protein